MNTFQDFVKWAGGQKEAAELIGISKYRSHRLYHGRQLRPEEATAIEAASNGAFKRDALIFGNPEGRAN